jgi:pimeloyl-ACP methyl ester carboxylesterase
MRTIKVGDTELHYVRQGSGPLVLLIQGVGVAGGGWRPQVDALAAEFTTVAFDNRGIGRSPAGRAPLTIARMAADALAILDVEGAARAHVVGHSMGGVIAQALALAAPERVASLSLLCTFANGRDGAGMSPGMLWRGLRTRVGTRAMRRLAMMNLIMPPGFITPANRDEWAATLAGVFGRDLADQAPIAMAQLRAMSRFNQVDRLGALAAIPTLVVSGAHDLIARPSSGRALAAAIPGARYVEFPDAAHALPIQCAEKVNALLLAHLRAL